MNQPFPLWYRIKKYDDFFYPSIFDIHIAENATLSSERTFKTRVAKNLNKWRIRDVDLIFYRTYYLPYLLYSILENAKCTETTKSMRTY